MRYSQTPPTATCSRPLAHPPLRSDLEDTAPERGPIRIQLDAVVEPIVLEAPDGNVTAYVARARNPTSPRTTPAGHSPSSCS